MTKLIKLLSIIAYCLLLTASSFGQSISRKVISTAGGTLTGGSSQITFNIGETVIPTLSAGGSIITQGFEQPGEQIRTGTIATLNLCAGNAVSVPFNAIDIGGGNTFTAELSDASGSFAVPVSIGTLAGNASGTISATIPALTPAGIGYRIRVVSSSPGAKGTDNGVNIIINTTAPAQPAAITGAPLDVCPPATGITLTTTNDPTASSYTWYMGPGTNGVTFNPASTTNTQVIDLATTSNSTYGIRVVANNACGASAYRSISIRRAVSTPAAVTGPVTVCANGTYGYSTAPVTGATSYLWSGPAGTMFNGSNPTPYTTASNSVSATLPAGFTTGTIGVAAQVACFTSTVKTLAVSTSAVALGVITGNAVVCPGQTYAYTVPASSGAASYTWTLPAGATGTSSTNSINVTYGASVPSANVCVTATSICGVNTLPRCKSVAPGIPAQPASITGPTNGLCNQTINYTCPSQVGVTYNWTGPAGSVVNSGQGTNGISITFPIYSDVPAKTLCVTASNSCGTSAARCITVRGAPNTPASITANPSSWCANTSGIEFNANTSNVSGNYTLSWTYPGPSVATYVIGGGNTTMLLLDWGTGSGNVTVTAQNACGSGTKILAASSTCREDEIGAEATAMQVYPNPSTGIVNVDFTATISNVIMLTVTDMAGRIVTSQPVETAAGINRLQLDLSHVAKGVYTLNLSATSVRSRIVIE